MCSIHFDAIVFGQLFFLSFQISNHARKAFIFNKNEGNNQKVENKIMVRVGVGRAYCPNKMESI